MPRIFCRFFIYTKLVENCIKSTVFGRKNKNLCHTTVYLERLLFLIQCLFIPVSAGVQGTCDKQQPPPAPGETAQPGPSPNPAQRSGVQQHEQQQHRQRFRHRPHVAPGKATTNSNFGVFRGVINHSFSGDCVKKPLLGRFLFSYVPSSQPHLGLGP